MQDTITQPGMNMDDATLRKLQLTELSILRDFHALCMRHKLRYFLTGGTLLGAVRHGGFIPWDDDLDVVMPRPDYERFLTLCEQGAMGGDYCLHHFRTDPAYYLPFAKIRKNHTLFDEQSVQHLSCHKGIFIDVFPLDYAKHTSGLWYRLKPFLLRILMVAIWQRTLGKKRVHIAHHIVFLLTRPLSVRTLHKLRDRLAASCKRGKYYISYGSHYGYRRQTMPLGYYEPAGTLNFEGEAFCAPCQPQQVLASVFGDYMRIPPPQERANHNATRVLFDTRDETAAVSP